jgi:FHA domain
VSSNPVPVLISAALIGFALHGGLQTAAASLPPTGKPEAQATAQTPAGPGSSAASGQSIDQQKQQQINDLLAKADQEQDLKKKIAIYDKILHKDLDPNNQTAYERRKDAQAKLDELQRQKQEQQQQNEQQRANQQKKERLLEEARKAWAVGDLVGAGTAISQARNLAAPDDPEVKHLEGRVQQANMVEQRVRYIWGGSGIVALAGLIGLLFAKRGDREPYLEIVDGPNRGRRYKLQQEVTMIGAVDEFGGVKNDIVLPDPDRNVSRFHCRILKVGKKLYLLDKESVNGTWVDRKRVHHDTAVRLKKDARISLAEVYLLRLGFERKHG